ncbi:hypothetical protein PR202_gb03292 [Eleusine coracana subsp. coracana]|uniref:DUF7597 domain-containing protein n=1 Tax=Eleusine coracana subsp. coracana TaxID=191504 RepID=A0AAV5E1H3_ELECO|nr:hypothetical protein PR202_gb03211 [Eleusine coracana subsp. coracana]GJN16317.1 hypothetical protein PR202_gb03292 [Eleusine coracana subsp. coracana]
MAYNHIDPSPFIPRGFEHVEVLGRATMVQVIGGRPPPCNEDMAIVAIDPMPLQQAPFANIREVLGEFFRDHIRVRVIDMQPCPFGQAYVRFDRISDRDVLVDSSPHQFGDVFVYLAKHNRGPNHTMVQYNHECWLILIGFPLDYWTRPHIESAISAFGKLEVWEQDLNHLSRVLIKARVLDITLVPKWIVISEGDGMQGETWIVQHEVVHRTMLGNVPQDEDPIPAHDDNVDQQPFDFLGFDQMAPEHVFGMPIPDNLQMGQMLKTGACGQMIMLIS